jgi:hypothetical protein
VVFPGNDTVFKGLFIGIDRYVSPEINQLSCARRDALALYALFTDTFGGQSALIVDEAATAREIGTALAELRPRVLAAALICGHQRAPRW